MTRDSRWAWATITLGVVLIGGLLAALALDLGASPATPALVAIPTSDAVPGQACNGALLEGKLIAHPQWGLAVQNIGAEPLLVFWPHGWYRRDSGDHVELLDPDGEVIARAGDHISAGGGGININGVSGFKMCPRGPTISEPFQP